MRGLLCLMAAALTLSACSQKTEKPPEPELPRVDKLNGVDINAPLSVIGTEPFWSLMLKETDMTLERPDHPDQVVPRHPFEINKDKDGAARAELISDEISLTLIAQNCSDGMSDRIYPLTAEATVGDEVFKGCALPTDALDKTKP
ncbi:COG3650 family protein [Asticcacaulis sp. YBE204]|uniref:COG3650 family protein n=1 Tax=Asticcacaulis sp. YBE204 TaxID=1282363 RepID=UPI0003C3F10E|nr:hypothetical protein [Asticcacaulis sp. YBE204]ESQ80423.1 hypothetical protein AEYBE204_03925 [Asticcacaulis sp. YBE204]